MMSALGRLKTLGENSPHVIPTTWIELSWLAWQLLWQFARHSGNSSLSVSMTLAPHREATMPGKAVPAPSYNKYKNLYDFPGIPVEEHCNTKGEMVYPRDNEVAWQSS